MMVLMVMMEERNKLIRGLTKVGPPSLEIKSSYDRLLTGWKCPSPHVSRHPLSVQPAKVACNELDSVSQMSLGKSAS